MSSNEEKPSVLSNRVFKVRDWNRLEAYRLETKIQALESERKWTHTRMSFEQREVEKDLLKLREAKHWKPVSLAERRLGFALKRSSSDLALTIERCQQAFTGPSSAAQRRCRADSEPPGTFILPPVTGERRNGVSTPPSRTERRFNASHNAVEDPKSRLLLRQQSWTSSRAPAPARHQVEKLEESTDSSVGSPHEITEEERADPNAQGTCPSITSNSPSLLSSAGSRHWLRRSYSTNSILTLRPAGKQLRHRELASLSETDRLPRTKVPSPGPSRGGEDGSKLTALPLTRTRQRSYTMPGLSTDGPRHNEKLEPTSSEPRSGHSTAEPLLE